MNDILSYEEQAVFRLRALYERNGYRPYRMSKFEEYDLYAENKGFLVSSNIITFTDLSGRLMALKPDVTLSIIKNYPNDGVMEKVYYDESVYRASSPDSGYQEITQMGLECIGCVDDYSTAEVVRLAVESLALIRGEYLLNLSHMGFLRGLFDEMHLSEKQSSQLLRAICSKNTGELRQTLTDWAVPHRLIQTACSLTALHGPLSQQLQPLAALSVNDATDAACRELRALDTLLQLCGCAENVVLDFSLASQTAYYNGVLFQGFVRGVPSAVLSGGRYDGLLEKLGKRAGAIGFAVYLNLLERLGGPGREYDADILLCYDDGTDPAALSAEVQSLLKDGRCVRVQKGSPGKLRCRQLMQMKDTVVEIVETNA